MNMELLERLKKLQKIRGDLKAFYNHDEFLVWSDSVSPLLEFDKALFNRFKSWSEHVKTAYRMGRDHYDALGESIGIVNQAITKLEIQPLPEKKNQSMRTNVEYPDKITLKWLYQHVPWSFWAWFIGFLITVFSIGLAVSETPLYKTVKSNISSINVTKK